MIKIKQAININKHEYISVCLPKQQEGFREIAKIGVKNKYRGIFMYDDGYTEIKFTRDYTKGPNEEYLPIEIKVLYSRHSSYSETQKFVNMFRHKPFDIYPITESFKRWQTGFNMRNLYDIKNAIYDSRLRKVYESCNNELKDNPDIKKITSNWTSTSINNEKNDVNSKSFSSISTVRDFDFTPIGQDVGRLKENQSFDNRKR